MEPSSPVTQTLPTSPDSAVASPLPERGGFRGRRRGRPSVGGSIRGKNPRGGPSHNTVVPFDRHGNSQSVHNDEIVLEEDPAGEQKVDKDGNLLGGREYRCRTFTIMNRGNRLYMLSTEPARCIGFRDSYLFFQKHKQLYKIIVTEQEKFDMIARGLIPHSYKGRAIGVLTARSAFREFGARIIVAGRRVNDDYFEREARERGDNEGELADPDDKLPPMGQPYNKNQYVAWHGASSVYHTNTNTAQDAKKEGGSGIFGAAIKKKKVLITEKNWMFEHAKSARYLFPNTTHVEELSINKICCSNFNHLLSLERKTSLTGVYEPHTNLTFYPSNLQPSVAKWELISPDLPDNKSGGNPNSNRSAIDFNLLTPAQTFNFKPMYKCDEKEFLPLNDRGSGLRDVPADVYSDLPSDIKRAIKERIEKEQEWENIWQGGEAAHGMRSKMRI